MRRRLEIVEAASEVQGRIVRDTPKSHQLRSVPLRRSLIEDLAVQMAGRDADDPVFPAPEGGVLRLSNFRRRCFDSAAATIGLPGLVPHELRHTAASLAISAGATVKGVQAMLGHASATVTLDRYGHLFPDELDAVADRLDEAAARASADYLRTNGQSSIVPLPLLSVENAI
jgi:integrase